jgi:NAD-dependent dihydropyrimidine dehydrogenase PreA subunit
MLMDLHLEIDQPKCIDCAKCIKGCPVGALAMERNGKIYYPEYEGRVLF